jgi:hypothetical protein
MSNGKVKVKAEVKEKEVLRCCGRAVLQLREELRMKNVELKVENGHCVFVI